MKIGSLISLGHNISASLASGMGFMIGVYTTDIFKEASAGSEGYITVDFLNATTNGSPASATLLTAIKLYRDVLPEFCRKHNIDFNDVALLAARFGTDHVYGAYFSVTVESSDGRRSTDKYSGFPGKRLRKGIREVSQ